ncbi:MAG TPA: glycosyltransferase family 1 protein [Candidatus Dormibacteraeota bacterium]|nr:glycosyltransferase family 1 protein [Candidatus Dormibacteraeota bacterium]
MTFANRNRGGSGVYARSLLAALGERDDVVAWEIAGPARSGLAGTLRWLAAGAQATLRRRPPDLVHCPSFVTPWRLRQPFVVTVHDAGVWRFPEDHPLEWRVYDRALLTRRLRAAARVIAGSEFGRREVIEGYRLSADRVTTVHYGIDARFLEAGAADPAPGEADRMLFPGAPAGHKNLAPVLRVMAAADPGSALGRAGLDISGARAEDYPALRSEIASLSLERRVRWLGHLDSEALPDLMRRAALVVYPSLYEGFGFPPLEAMAVGTPVVASDRGPLPELLGDAALLVDPTDPGRLAEALEAVLAEPERRRRMGAEGRRRALLFTWARCAEETVDVYRDVLGTGGA